MGNEQDKDSLGDYGEDSYTEPVMVEPLAIIPPSVCTGQGLEKGTKIVRCDSVRSLRQERNYKSSQMPTGQLATRNAQVHNLEVETEPVEDKHGDEESIGSVTLQYC